ncbi:cytochrome c3 family protein [Deferrisoma sp.]
MTRIPKDALIALAAVALGLGAAGITAAGTCIEDGCHAPIMQPQFLHGPVAAEEAGADGCVSCHVPAGQPCTASKAGKYKFKTKPDRLCLLCHERGTGTQHTRAGGKCLSCHDPHGSERSSKLMRAG